MAQTVSLLYHRYILQVIASLLPSAHTRAHTAYTTHEHQKEPNSKLKINLIFFEHSGGLHLARPVSLLYHRNRYINK